MIGNFKYAYKEHSIPEKTAYKAYRYRSSLGKFFLIEPPIAIVMRDHGNWVASLMGIGMEVAIGQGTTRDKAVDNALASIEEG
jgi:hypothetical protein